MSAMTTALLHRGSRFGDLRLTGYVGSGGFSDVYEAFDKSGRRLAIKVLRLTGLDSEGQQQRIEREREALSRIGSRGVAKLLHSDLQCETPWIASEFVDGPTLQEIVEEGGPLGRDEGLSLIRRLAEILDELHQEGIAHRDLSPNNIIIGPDGPVIIDFGSARIDLEGGATGSLLIAGTSGFVPPEGLRGEPVGKAGDIYALGRVAEFILGLPLEPGTVLRQTLNEAPDNRPSADLLAYDLAQFDLVVARSTKREISKLTRRFRARSLVAASILVIAPTSFLTAVVVGNDSELRTQSLFEDYEGAATASWSNGLFSLNQLPPDWTIERIRPIDSVFGFRETDLDAIQVRFGDVEAMDTNTDYVYGQIKVASIARFHSVKNAPSTEELLQQLFDQTVDLFEVGYLPNGCSMIRADVALNLSDTASILAAYAPPCAGLTGEKIMVGITIDVESNVMAQWYIDSTVSGAESIFPLGVELPTTSPVVELADDKSWLNLTKLTDPQTRAVYLKSASDFVTYEWGSFGFVLNPGHGIKFTGGASSDAQLSFYLIDPNNGSNGDSPVPAGRWWLRTAGEEVTILNPFKDRVFLFTEAESFAESPIDVSMSPVKGISRVESLRSSLGVEWESAITYDRSNESAQFSLPQTELASSSSPPFTAPFKFGTLDLSFDAELSGASFGFDDLTVITRADSTQSSDEIGDLEDHDAHFMLFYAPTVELALGQETSAWVSLGKPTGCSHNVEWEINTSRAILLVDAYLGCWIDDADYTSVASTVPQANIIFRFALLDSSTGISILGGSFAPKSSGDFERFRLFLKMLSANGTEIVRHHQTLQGS